MRKYWIQSGILGCGLLLGFLLGGAGQTPAKAPAPPPEETQKSAWLIIEENNGGKGAWNISPQGRKSLLENMETLTEEKRIEMKTQDFPGLGVMIEELEGRKNGEGGKYWQYWVNETYAKVGAGAYIPHGGDIIEWKFTNQQKF